MAVCLRICMDHNLSNEQLWELTGTIPTDERLNYLLKELEDYEDQIGSSPIGGYNNWEKEFNSIEEFTKLINEGPAAIRNNVFSLHIAKKGLIIDHWTKLGYFCDDKLMQTLFEKITEILAKHFSSTTAIYVAESAYKTELLSCMIYEGEDIKTIICWIEDEGIRIAESVSKIKRPTQGRYYETDACYIRKFI